VSDTQLQKRTPTSIKEKGQYLLAFGVVATMLLVAQFPLFVIFFFGVFAYFLMRMFSAGSRSETREVFEFYLTANEILRDDERRWFGFEINDAIRRGEEIVHRMSPAPPLVYFSLGALQNKIGNHKAAISNLAHIAEEPGADESMYTNPSPEFRSYVKVLRKIEREPADAPLTSAAVRALERARKLRAKTLLEDSRQKFSAIPVSPEPSMLLAVNHSNSPQHSSDGQSPRDDAFGRDDRTSKTRQNEKVDPFVDRKPISEVLHDIYDNNIQ
jgi:hypothetical protein